MKTNLMFAAAFCVCIAGCTGSDNQTETTTVVEVHDDSSHNDHNHPTHGPHEGELIELGNEDYHAELVHGEPGISIYLLDSSAKQPVVIPATTLVLSLKKDGAVKTFELAAKPEPDAPEGQTSHFASDDEELHQWLDGGAEGALSLEIQGKSFTGKVAHDHEHEEHDHHDHQH